MQLCGREECVYASVQQMIDKMKKEVAEREGMEDAEQIVVAKIYYIAADILAEACRRNFKIDRKQCEPSKGFKPEQLTLDTFILLKQLKDEGFIEQGYKQTIFDSLIELKPEIKKLVEGDQTRGLI